MSELYIILAIGLGVVVLGFVLKKLFAFIVLAVLIVAGGYFYLGEDAFNEKAQETQTILNKTKEKAIDSVEKAQELIEEAQEAIKD